MGAGGYAGAIMGVMGGVANLASSIESSVTQKEAMRAQQKYLNKMESLAEDKLALFQRKQQAWESVFGSIQDNLAGYYNNLDPNSFAAKNIQNLEMEYNRANTQVNEELARRGLSGSGASISANAGLASDLATRRAEARTNAAGQVAQQQLGYLTSVGIPQQQMITAGLSGSYDSLLNATGNIAQVYAQQASQAGQMAANSASNVGKSIMQGIQLGLFDSVLNSNNTSGASSSVGSSSNSFGTAPTISSITNSSSSQTVPNISPLAGRMVTQWQPFDYKNEMWR